MKLRPLKWEDVEARIGTFYDVKNCQIVPHKAKGKTRVYVALKNCSFINITIWMIEPDLGNAVTRASLLLQITKKLNSTVEKFAAYELT